MFGAKMQGTTEEIIQRYIYYFGVWEPNLSEFISSRLLGEQNRTFIDVGANIGYFTLMASYCMPKGRIVAIEAAPSIFSQLLQNVDLNHCENVRLVQAAATDCTRDVKLFPAPTADQGRTTILDNRFGVSPILVQGKPLNQLLTSEEILTTRLVKIDVEGAELEVVAGLAPLLESFPKDTEFVVEFTPDESQVQKCQDFFSTFEGSGFLAYALENDYDPDAYIYERRQKFLRRVNEVPKSQTDIVFSRIDSDRLNIKLH